MLAIPLLERFAFVAISEIHAGRRAEPITNAADSGSPVPDSHQLVGVRVRQRLDRHVVHDSENRGIGSDADGQRADGENRELSLTPSCVTGVAFDISCAPRSTFRANQGTCELSEGYKLLSVPHAGTAARIRDSYLLTHWRCRQLSLDKSIR